MAEPARRLPSYMTVEEFLEWPGDGTGMRYELVDGVLRAQEPASDAHGTILANLAMMIGNHLRANRPGCRVVGAPGIQPAALAGRNFRIPDLGVTCSPNVAGARTIPAPVLLLGILSPSNARDTWANVPVCTGLPSVCEILLVHSSQVKAELLRRDPDGGWPADTTVCEGWRQARLESVGFELPLAEVYAGTHLATQ